MSASEFIDTAWVRGGQMKLRHREAFAEWCKELKDGAELSVIVETLKAARSTRQNRAYFATVVRPLALHTGHTVNQCHELLKARVFPKDIATGRRNGFVVGELVIGATTTSLSNAEFSQYMAECREYLFDEFKIRTQEPSPDWYLRDDDEDEAAA